MKKLFTLVAIMCSLALSSNAQRLVDIQTTVTSPTAGTTIQPSTSFTLSFYVKNLSTVALKPTDSIIYQISWGPYIITTTSGGVTYSAYIIPVGKTMNQNDTLRHSRSLSIAYTTPNKVDSTFDLCITALPAPNRGTDSVKDNITTNNKSCVSTIRKANYTGTGIFSMNASDIESQVSLFPNPVQSTANFSVLTNYEAAVTINVMDLSGRTVIRQNEARKSGARTVNIDTKHLNAGTYLYHVTIEGSEEVKTGKMVVIK